MKKRLRENIEIGDRVFAPRDEFEGTVIDINGDEVLVDGPFGEEYHNLNDLEKLGGDYEEDNTPDFFKNRFTESKRKKVIGLTESDLARIVKRTIMELDRSTYDKAADFADQKKFPKLANKFREHGKEFGLNQDRDNITMVVRFRDDEQFLNVRINSIKGSPGYSQSYVMKTEDLETGNQKTFMISKYPGEVEFYLNGDYTSLPETRGDAKKVLTFFEKNGVDVSDIDPRSISYDDSGF